MKLPLNKALLRDAIRRTRLARILFLVLGIGLEFSVYRMLRSDYFISPVHITVIYAAVLLAVQMITLEVILHAYRFTRKREVFFTLPVGRTEWFYTTTLFKIVNLFVYVTVLELANAVILRLAPFFIRQGSVLNLPAFHFRRAVYLFVIGLVLIGVLSLVREMTHSFVSWGVMLAALGIGYYLMMPLYEEIVTALSGEFADIGHSLLMRTRLVFRQRAESWISTFDGPQAYFDSLAVLINFLAAVGLIALSRYFVSKSDAEYAGAEYHNKRLFRILLAGATFLTLILVFSVLFLLGSEYVSNVILFPVVLLLVLYLLCRMFREKPRLELARYALIGIVVFACWLGAAKLTEMNASRIPDKEKVVAAEIDRYGGVYTSDEAIAYLVGRVEAAKENRSSHNPKDHQPRATFILYTENSRKEYLVPYDPNAEYSLAFGGGMLPHVDTESLFCYYGSEPFIASDGWSRKDYDRLTELSSDLAMKERAVYVMTVAGGMKKAKESYILPYDDGDGAVVYAAPPVVNAPTYPDAKVPAHSEAAAFLYTIHGAEQKELFDKMYGYMEGNFWLRIEDPFSEDYPFYEALMMTVMRGEAFVYTIRRNSTDPKEKTLPTTQVHCFENVSKDPDVSEDYVIIHVSGNGYDADAFESFAVQSKEFEFSVVVPKTKIEWLLRRIRELEEKKEQ